MTEEALSKLNIELGGSLKLKTDYKARVVATEKLGMTEHWSSEGLYRHLRVLQNLVPRAVGVCECNGHISHVGFIRMKRPRAPGSIPSSSAHLQ